MLAAVELFAACMSVVQEIAISFCDSLEMFRATVFFAYQLALTAAVLLVVIAGSRYVKIVMDEHEVRLLGRVKGRSLRALLMRVCRAINTARGAKIASVVACLVTIPIACPASAILGKTTGNDTCAWNVGSEYTHAAKVLHVFHFLCYLAVTAALVAMYGAILRRLRKNERDENSEIEPRPNNRRSVFYTRQSASLGALLEAQNAEAPGVYVKRMANRTLSEGDAVALAAIEKSRNEPESPRSVCQPFRESQISRLTRDERNAELTGSRIADSGGDTPQNTEIETNRQTYFPPVSYSAQLTSLINLSIAERKLKEEREEAKSRHQRQNSCTSFRFRWSGDRARQTTLVFVIISAIHVLSLFPYFLLVLTRAFSDDPNEEPTSGVIFATRLHLLSNAATPVVYGFGNPHFRSTLWKIFICRREVI